MRGGRSDTDPEAERILFAGYARMTPAESVNGHKASFFMFAKDRPRAVAAELDQ